MLANRLQTIQRASRWLRVLLILLGVLLVINRINAWMQPFLPDTRTLLDVVFHGAAVTGKIEILWSAQLVLGTALYLKALYDIIMLLGLYAKGELFTTKNVARFRRLGLTFAFAPAIWLIVLIGAWPEIVAAQDQWVKVMPTFPGGAIIGSCIFMFASRLMNEGRELRDEHNLVI